LLLQTSCECYVSNVEDKTCNDLFIIHISSPITIIITHNIKAVRVTIYKLKSMVHLIYQRIRFKTLRCVIVSVSINLFTSHILKRICRQVHVKYLKLLTRLLNVIEFIFSPLSFFDIFILHSTRVLTIAQSSILNFLRISFANFSWFIKIPFSTCLISIPR